MACSPQFTTCQQLLLAVIRDPRILVSKTPREWDTLLRLLRRTRLLGRIAYQIADAGLMSQVPSSVASVLTASNTYIAHRQQQIQWELNRIAWALYELDIKPILLKGSAYLAMDLPNSHGRLLADVDLLFRAEQLATVEKILAAKGWRTLKLNSYDQRYYRMWMHELPPLRHEEREIEVDLHHNILPLTSRLKPRPELLFDEAVAENSGRFQILSPVDLVIHSATHMFYDGDITDSIRDLVDIDSLLRVFSKNNGFWEKLAPRARQLDLIRPLFYALRYARKYLGTPIPETVFVDADRGVPSRPVLSIMDYLVPLALFPHHPDYHSSKAARASWLLYIRSHWLRMPPWLLARHLTHKGWRRVLPGEEW